MAYIVYHAFRIWIDNKIADEDGDIVDVAVEQDSEDRVESASRLSTLLPLFRVDRMPLVAALRMSPPGAARSTLAPVLAY